MTSTYLFFNYYRQRRDTCTVFNVEYGNEVGVPTNMQTYNYKCHRGLKRLGELMSVKFTETPCVRTEISDNLNRPRFRLPYKPILVLHRNEYLERVRGPRNPSS